MGFGLCLGEQRGSSHVSCAEGWASRAVNAAEVEGSVIPWLLAILTAFSISLSLSLFLPVSLLLAYLSQNPERARRNHSGSAAQLQVRAVMFASLVRKRIAVEKPNCWSVTHSTIYTRFGRLQRVWKDSGFSPEALLLLMFMWSGRCCVFNNTADAAPKHMALISHPHAELTAEPPSVLMSWPRDARTRWGSF